MNHRIGIACIASLIAWAAPAQAALIYDFQLNGSFANAVGADSIRPSGGSLGATGYAFGANQGLSIELTETLSVYTIEAAFHLSAVDRYRKIIDFKNLSSDYGLYTLAGQLAFFPYALGGASIAPGEDVVATLSRDAAGTVSATLNGIQVWTMIDHDGHAVFDSGFIHLFMDDTDYQDDQTAGFINYVQVYDTSPVAAPVPEPATWAMMIGGFALVGAALRRRKVAASLA